MPLNTIKLNGEKKSATRDTPLPLVLRDKSSIQINLDSSVKMQKLPTNMNLTNLSPQVKWTWDIVQEKKNQHHIQAQSTVWGMPKLLALTRKVADFLAMIFAREFESSIQRKRRKKNKVSGRVQHSCAASSSYQPVLRLVNCKSQTKKTLFSGASSLSLECARPLIGDVQRDSTPTPAWVIGHRCSALVRWCLFIYM